jgi:integrase
MNPTRLPLWADAKRMVGRICDAIMGRAASEHPAELKEKTFRWFAENIFVPARKTRWRETTAYTVQYFLDKIYRVFGDTRLTDMTDVSMQTFLNGLVEKKYSRTVVQHCLLYLRAILKEAHEEGVLLKNPARRLSMPDGIKQENRPYLSLAEYTKLLSAMPVKRDQLMVKLLYLGGLRRGELFAIRWRDLDGTALAVSKQINRFGHEADVKTRASVGRVALPEDLRADLVDLRKWSPRSTDESLVFPSRAGTTINPKNWLDRVLKPAGKTAGLTRISYHMFRRGLATELHQDGEVDRNIQSQLRHSNSNITRAIYIREVPAAQQAALERFSTKINAKPKAKSKAKSKGEK